MGDDEDQGSEVHGGLPSNLSTPVVLALSWLTLHETLDRRTVIGSSLIVAGGIVTAL